MTNETPRLRFDVTTHDWVLFAPARARRPHASPTKTLHRDSTSECPFCPGHEHETPEEILRVPSVGGGEGWSVRVVPNKFPALDRSASPEQVEQAHVFREMGGYGAHEIVVESPDHHVQLAQQPCEQVERVLCVIHERFESLAREPRLRMIVVFKNQGERAGASLTHPHWQLLAAPLVPRLLRLKHDVATEYFDVTSKCVYCVTLAQELAAGERVLVSTDDYVVVSPYASQVPYQLRILPREHQSSFGRVAPARLGRLAEVLLEALVRLDRALGAPPFNITLGTAPVGDEDEPYFHWHLDILPRLTTPAGFELGSGMAINPVLPEDAARELRASTD